MRLPGCERYREALSARWDGEPIDVPADVLKAHVAGCDGCRRFAQGLLALDELVAEASGSDASATPSDADVPDRSAAILAGLRGGTRGRVRWRGPAGWRPARVGLLLVGVTGLVTALADLLGGGAMHPLRDLGAFEIALAVGFIVAGLRPATAEGLLPTAVALGTCLLAVAVADTVGGRTALEHEVVHGTELVGVALVWMVAREAPRPPVRPSLR